MIKLSLTCQVGLVSIIEVLEGIIMLLVTMMLSRYIIYITIYILEIYFKTENNIKDLLIFSSIFGILSFFIPQRYKKMLLNTMINPVKYQ